MDNGFFGPVISLVFILTFLVTQQSKVTLTAEHYILILEYVPVLLYGNIFYLYALNELTVAAIRLFSNSY